MLFDLFQNFFPALSSLFFLYAETHYKFRGVYSRLNKNEPEIIADVPHRLQPGTLLPVLILFKDANLFPVELKQVDVTLLAPQKLLLASRSFNKTIDQALWYKVLQVALPDHINGRVAIDVCITIRANGRTLQYHNDNYRISGHQPFRIAVDAEPLPGEENWYWGDLHYHSFFTRDQVEFGAPVQATVQMAKAMGVHFFAVTDHSYDLDDRIDDYLTNDPDVPKWHQLRQVCRQINSREKAFVVLPGEELSAGNCKKQNVHFLVINNPHFYAGWGDSAEQWFRTRPQHGIRDVLNTLDDGALAFAGHPEIVPPLLQKILIRRGKWMDADYEHPRLDGLQIWNGKKDAFFERGIRKWVQLLLRGKRLSIVAGNDAHGNFGRFRQIGFPFFSLRENQQELFAQARTGVYIPDDFSFDALVDSLKKGRTIITDGPFANIVLSDRSGNRFFHGDTFTAESGYANVTVQSSRMFGTIQSARLFIGDRARQQETVQDISPAPSYRFQRALPLHRLPRQGYLRLEVRTKHDEEEFRCLTNAIYIDRKTKLKQTNFSDNPL